VAGILGGGNSLLPGAQGGGGGTDIDLSPGTILRVRIDSPLEVR
jgi:hypothetical protein